MEESVIKKQFIKETLTKHGESLIHLFEQSIAQNNLINKGELLNSLDYEVKASGDFGGELLVKFITYGRFQDMGAGKKKKKSQQEELLASFIKRRKKNERKPVKWYTRNVYGSLNTLIYLIENGLDDATINTIKKNLEEVNKWDN